MTEPEKPGLLGIGREEAEELSLTDGMAAPSAG